MNYFDMVKPTYIENWTAALYRLSIPQVDVPMTVVEAKALGSNLMDFAETFDSPPRQDISGLRQRVEEAIRQFAGGCFVRLGSRSPKDSWRGCRQGFRVSTQEEAFALLCDASERISDDLHLAIANDYAPHIFVRKWEDFPVWSEFRCFMRGRKLVGISQYQHREKFDEIGPCRDVIERTIRSFFLCFRSAVHLDNVVFDVFVHPCDDEAGPVDVTVIEINPFFELTDPCLFNWKDGGDFDGSFRWRKT